MFNAILWPVDGSPLSLSPLQHIIALARLSRASVKILSIAEPRQFRAADADAVASGVEVEAMHIEDARRAVESLRVQVQQAGIDCRALVALSALPSAEIVTTSERQGCDLIVMATRGKLGLVDTLLDPSCTQAVIGTASVPVLVFP